MYQYCTWRIKDQHTLKVPCENAILKHVKSYIPMFLFKNLTRKTHETARIHQPWVPCLPFCTNKKQHTEATDRAHRIGQKKTVFVHKLICKAGIVKCDVFKALWNRRLPGIGSHFFRWIWDVLFLKDFHIDLK